MDVRTAQVWRESKIAREMLCFTKETAVQVWRESKIAREMLCFTIETAVGGREGRRCRTGGCGAGAGYARAIPQWQAWSEVADRKAMRGILLGNAITDS